MSGVIFKIASAVAFGGSCAFLAAALLALDAGESTYATATGVMAIWLFMLARELAE